MERAEAGEAGLGTALALGGAAWSDVAGGTSGALWGAGLMAAGASIGDDDEPTVAGIRGAARAFLQAITDQGRAQVGDKTMVDAIVPFVEALESGSSWAEAAREATSAAEATADIIARRGRSRIHGERSLGTPDAGATSFAIVVTALAAWASAAR